MPYVDYREWYRQEQERRRRAGLPGAVGAPGTYRAPQPYKPSTLEQAGSTAVGIASIPGVPQAIGNAISGSSNASTVAAGANVASNASNAANATNSGFMGLTNGTGGLTNLGYGAAGLGTIAGGYGLYDSLRNDRGIGSSAASGAAMGAGIGSMIAPGIGTAIGALIGGAGGAGLGAAFGVAPRTQVEEKRWKKLKQAGFDIPKWVEEGQDIKDPNAWYNKDLAPDFVGNAPETGQWTNNKFAMSRDEADLRPEDIWGYADNAETFGKNWMDGSEDARRQIMQLALDNHLVKEGKGTVDIEWTPELLDQAQTILGDSLAQNPKNQGRKRWVPPTNKWTPP